MRTVERYSRYAMRITATVLNSVTPIRVIISSPVSRASLSSLREAQSRRDTTVDGDRSSEKQSLHRRRQACKNASLFILASWLTSEKHRGKKPPDRCEGVERIVGERVKERERGETKERPENGQQRREVQWLRVGFVEEWRETRKRTKKQGGFRRIESTVSRESMRTLVEIFDEYAQYKIYKYN